MPWANEKYSVLHAKAPRIRCVGLWARSWPRLEVETGGQQRRTTGRLVGEVRRVSFVVVGLVGQVLHVQLQVDVLGQLVAGHGVVARVRRHVNGVGRVAVNLVDVERAAADGQLWRDVIGCPQAESVFRRVGHLVALVGTGSDDTLAVAVFAGVNQLAFQVAVAGEHLPLFGELAAGGQFDAVHSRFARGFVGVGVHQNARVFLLGTEDRAGQGQAVVEQVPLGAQLVVDGFFGFQVAGVDAGNEAVGFLAFTDHAAGRRCRGGVGGVDAAVLQRFPDQARLPVEELAVVLDFAAPRGGVGVSFGVEGVVAQAEVQQPFRVQLKGIEHVGGAAGGLGVGAVVVARDAAGPGVIRRRVAQRGALPAQAAFGHGAGRVGVRADCVAADAGFFAGEFQAGGVRVLHARQLETAEQVGLVGGGVGGRHSRVSKAPHGAETADVALAVVRLSEHVVLAGAAMAQGVFQRHVVVQVVLDGERADIGAGLAEVAVFQAVEVVAVAAIGGFVVPVGSGGRRAVAVGNARVRQVVAFHVVVAEVDARRRAQAEGQRRRYTPAVIVDDIAASHVLLVAHQVQAERGVVEELAVHVEHVAAGLVGAVGETTVGEVARLWRFTHQVDAAASRAPTAERGVRAFADFDRFDVEDLAALAAGVAHAVQVSVALGIKTANERTVALRVTAFTGTESNARYSAQGVLQRGGGGVFEHLLRHDGHRARGVYQWRGVLLRSGFFHLVGRVVLLLAGNTGGAQGDAVALAFLFSAFGRLRQLGGRAGAECYADGRSQHAW